MSDDLARIRRVMAFAEATQAPPEALAWLLRLSREAEAKRADTARPISDMLIELTGPTASRSPGGAALREKVAQALRGTFGCTTIDAKDWASVAIAAIRDHLRTITAEMRIAADYEDLQRGTEFGDAAFQAALDAAFEADAP